MDVRELNYIVTANIWVELLRHRYSFKTRDNSTIYYIVGCGNYRIL